MPDTIERSAVTTKKGGARPGAGRPKTSERDDVSVKVDRAAIAKARYVAEVRGVHLAEYLTETIIGPVERDFAEVTKGK